MGVHAGVWLRVGVGLSLWLVALSLWDLGVYFRSRLVLGARKYNGIRGNRKQLAADNASCEGTAWLHCSGPSVPHYNRALRIEPGGMDRESVEKYAFEPCAAERGQRVQAVQPR